MIEAEQLKKLNKDLNKIGSALLKSVSEIPHSVNRELVIGANDIRSTIIRSMQQTPKTGNIYKRGKKGRHIASSPGNPPAIDFGELVRSIMFDVDYMQVEIGAKGGAPYAPFLEFGTKKMKARPFLDPAVLKHKDEIINNMGNEIFSILTKPFGDIK